MLLTMHRARPFRGPVLVLGRQAVELTMEDVFNLYATVGVAPLPPPESLQRHIDAGEPVHGDAHFFGLMGLELDAMDVSPYEHAEIVHNLNQPIPPELSGRYGTVFDGGTIEHVFDVRTAFVNIANMLAPGGRVLHITPCNNYVNHGFWQPSPRSFYDFYQINGFTDLETTMIVHPRDYEPGQLWATFPFDPHGPHGAMSFFTGHDERLTCAFSATKTAASTSERIPEQSFDRAADGGTPVTGDLYTLKLTATGLDVQFVGRGE